MRKLFLLIPALVLALASYATTPSTDFSGGYTFAADDATRDGNIELNTLTETHYLRYFDREVNGTATWEVSVTKPCLVSVTLNMIDNSWNNASHASYQNGGHIFKVRILDGTTPKDSVEEASESSTYTAFTLSGQLYFEKAGNYTIELLNSRAWSKCGLSGITLTAASIPESSFASAYAFDADAATLHGADAQFLLETSKTPHYIRYADHSQPGPYVTWNIAATRECYVSVTLNFADNKAFYENNKHIMEVQLLDGYGNKLDTIAEGPKFTGDGFTENGVDKTLSGTLHIPAAGIYTLKMLNNRNNSKTGIYGITLAYVGGAVKNIADDANTTLDVADAWYSAGGTRADSKIDFPDASINDAWIRWNVHVAQTKLFDISVNIVSSNGHNYKVQLSNSDRTISLSEGGQTSAASPRELGRLSVPAGDYTLEVTNSIQHSDAQFVSVVFAPVAASSTALPGTLAFPDAVLSEKAFIQDGMLYFNAIGDTDPRGQWARWSVTTDHDGLFLFTMGTTSTNGQSYKITIKDDGDNTVDFYQSASLGSGDKTVKHYFDLASGDYSVIVENTTSYSKGHLTSLVVTEPDDVVTINEAATENTWSVDAENTYDVQTIRTLKGGEYNTFCVPFAVSSDLAKDVFGSDVEIYTLDEAVVESDGFVLNLTLKASSDIYQGTPVFIKPSRNIVNPVFCGVKFLRDAPATSTATHANFVGTFVSTTLSAGQDILFLGPNNTMYYPLEDIDIDGMRAWFVIHDAPAPASAIRRARIVERENVVTEIELVGEDNNQPTNVQKILHNGQLFILRDGIRYNALGNRVQ